MNALEQLNLAAPITDTYTAIESMIITKIAEQIAGNPQGLINNSSEWRIQMLARMGRFTKDTAKIISSRAKGVGLDIESAINSAAQSVLQANGLEMTGQLAENIRSALSNYDRQAIRGKYNQVNTVMQYKAKQAYLNSVNGVVSRFDRIQQKELDSKQEHLDVLNKNAMAAALGERSRTEALRATIEEMSDKGIPAFIDKAGREWSPEAYVNMDIRNTVKNAANAAQFAVIGELGQDIVLVSSHAGARPLCAPYQGKLYSLSGKSGTIRDLHGKEYHFGPWSGTSYGKPAGLLGINCGHTIRGVSDGAFVNREKQYDEKENSEEYEKIVKQRELERGVRKLKTKRNALKAAGDTEGVKEYNKRIKAANQRLQEYCDTNGLYNRRDRTEVYGYSKKSVLTAGQNGGIIEAEKYHAGVKESIARIKSKLDSKINPQYEEVSAEYLNSLPKLSKPESIQEALKATNPSGSDENCQRCVPAYMMRRKGYNVTASLPPENLLTDNLGFEDYKKVFIGSSWITSKGTGLEEITEFLKNEGHGATVEISIYTQMAGHLFAAENNSGNILFIDPQNGKEDVSYYFNFANIGETEYARIDNLPVSNLIKKCLEV